MTAPPAWVHTQERGDHLWVLELGGELDMDTAGQLRVSLLAVPAVHLVVDLSAVRFCGAAGVTLLLELRDHVETTGHQLQLMVPPRRARSLRFLLDEHLLASHRPTVGEAITALPVPGSRRRHSY